MVPAVFGIIIGVGFTWFFAWLYYRKANMANEDSTKLLFEQNQKIISLVSNASSELPPKTKERISDELSKIKHDTERSHPTGVHNLTVSMDYVPAIDRKCDWCNMGFIRNNPNDPSIASCDNGCGLSLKWSGKTWMVMR